MQSNLDKEYLERPLIEDVKYEYSMDRIRVACSHTGFIGYMHLEFVLQKDILDLYSRIIKKVRNLGIKVKYTNKYKKFIVDNWKNYCLEYDEYNKLYKEILEMLPELKRRGIHKGCSDDMYLNQIYKKGAVLDKYYYRNSLISQVNSIYRELQKIERDLETVSKRDIDSGNLIYTIYL